MTPIPAIAPSSHLGQRLVARKSHHLGPGPMFTLKMYSLHSSLFLVFFPRSTLKRMWHLQLHSSFSPWQSVKEFLNCTYGGEPQKHV